MNFNRVVLVGYLTRKPELKSLPKGPKVCSFRLAVNEWRKGRDGDLKKSTCFIDCLCSGPRGEAISRHLDKGRRILVEGRLGYREWKDSKGTTHDKHVVIVEDLEFMEPPAKGTVDQTA